MHAVLRQFFRGKSSISQLIKGGMFIMSLTFCGNILNYLIQVSVARTAGTFEYGLFAYAWTWMNLMFFVAAFGMNEATLRLVPPYLATNQLERAKGLVLRGRYLVFGIGTALGILAIGTILLLDDVIGHYYVQPLILATIAAPFVALMSFSDGVGRALNSVVWAYVPRTVLLPLSVLIGARIMIVDASPLHARDLMIVTVAAVACLSLAQSILVSKRLPPSATDLPAKVEVRHWLRMALPMLFVTVCYVTLNNAHLLMTGWFLTPDDVAVFHASARTAFLVATVLTATNALAAPFIARLYAEKKMQELQRALSGIVQVVFWPCLLIAGVMVFFGDFVLSLFGATFAQHGAQLLAILAISQLVTVSCGPTAYLMTMTGHQRECAIVLATAAILNVFLLAVMIPAYGSLGAAIATLICTVVWNLWMSILVKRRLDIQVHILSFAF